MASGADRIAVVENGPQRNDVIARVAVTQGAGAGRIVRQHAADGALCPAGRIGRETPSFAGQASVQIAMDDARLHTHAVGRNVKNLAEMPAEIDNEPGAERFAGHAAAGAAGNQRNAVLAGIAHQAAHIFLIARHHDAERLDLEDTGIGGVQNTTQIVKEDVPLDESLEIVADALGLRLVHRSRPRLAASVPRAHSSALAGRSRLNCICSRRIRS